MTKEEIWNYIHKLGIDVSLARDLADGTLDVTDLDYEDFEKLTSEAHAMLTDPDYVLPKADHGTMEIGGELRPVTERHIDEAPLTDEDIDVLMTDWFDRDGETFTKIVKGGGTGWEDTLEEGDSYSTYLVEAPDKKELLKRAYSLAKDMIIVMNPPFKVFVKVSKAKDSYTDGKKVVVSTAMFNDPDLTVSGMLDVFLGVTIHEGCHLLYTDFSYLSIGTHPIIHQLFNIIEDERIETLLGTEKPGLARFLEKTKYYYFDMCYLEYMAELEEKKKEETLFSKLFNIILRIVRYPAYLKEDDIVYFGHHLFDVKEALVPFPNSTPTALKSAERIFQIIKEFYVDEMRERTKDMSKEDLDKLLAGAGVPSPKGGTPTSGADLDKETLEKLSESVMEKDAKDLADKLPKAVAKDPEKELGSKDLASELREGTFAEELEGSLSIGKDRDTIFKKSKTNEKSYQESLDRVRRYIPAITKIVQAHCKEYKLIHRSMRSGVLDTSKLAEAYQGVSSVYIKEGEVRTDKVAVAILVDESGSMGGDRIQAAQDTAILLNEAIGKIPAVELYIYGHTGDIRYSGATELTIYREKAYAPKYALGSVSAKCENRDGTAIYETAVRVRSMTKLPVLFFILSDGAPSASGYRGKEAINHVKNTVQSVERMNFNVVQVCINHSYEPSSMFKHYVILEDMSRLAIDLGRVIKKSIMKKATVNIT